MSTPNRPPRVAKRAPKEKETWNAHEKILIINEEKLNRPTRNFSAAHNIMALALLWYVCTFDVSRIPESPVRSFPLDLCAPLIQLINVTETSEFEISSMVKDGTADTADL